MQPVVPPTPPKPKGGALLWIGGASIVVGIVLAIALTVNGFRSLTSTVNDYQRVSATEGGTIELDDTGSHLVFLERAGIDEDPVTFGGSESRFGTPSFSITAPNGEPVQLRPDFTSETYSVNGYDGRKIGKFTADQPGTYRITIQQAAFGDLAVGKHGPGSALLQVGLGIAGGGVVVVVGIVLMIIGGVRRSRSRQAFAPGYPGGPGAGWAPPPTGPGGWAPPPTGWGTPPAAPGWAAPPPPAGPPGWSPPPAAPPPPGQAWGNPPPPDPGWSPPPAADPGPQGPVS